MNSLPRLLCACTLILTSILRISASGTDALIEHIDSYVNSNPDSAIILCNDALTAHPSDGNLRQQLLTIRGNASFALGNYPEAIADFKAAVRQAEALADTYLCVNALSDLGVAYRVSQQPDSALACYNRALSMAEGHDMPEMESNILSSIAVLLANQTRFDEAVPFAEKALEISRQTGDIDDQIYAASTLGSALFLAGDHRRALETQRRIVAETERKGIPRYILKTYASIIAMHNRLGNTDSVSSYISRGLGILPKVPQASIESVGFMEQCFVILTAMGRYRESLDLQMKILDMQDSRPFMPLDRLWQRIAANYKGLGDIRRMDDAYNRSIQIADSIHQSDIDSQISDFNVRYRTAEKELEIARLSAAKSHRDTLLTLILAVIAIAALILFFYLRSRRRKIEIDNIRARLDGIEQERGRLSHELHDGVCNDLLGIELMLASSHCDLGELSSLISATRNDLRSISHELLPPRFNGLSLPQLLQAHAQKSSGFVNFTCTSPQFDIDPQSAINIYRIVQEWIANLRRHSSATAATVTLSRTDGLTSLEITDDGAPFDPSSASPSGLGLENISRRVKALNATWNLTSDHGRNTMSVKIFK